MATQITTPSIAQLALEIVEDIKNGYASKPIPLADLLPLGAGGVVWLEGHLAAATFRAVTTTFNEATFELTFSAAVPMSPSPDSASTSGSTKKKTPRPMNSFVIFRKAHHDQVKAENPGIHNNEISKIIGAKWRAAPKAVKDDYKAKAEDVKRQHAIDHPGYQYKPRKPSEKPKRNTKNKQAKAAAQDAATTSPAHYQNNTSQLTNFAELPVTGFGIVQGPAGDDGLHDQMLLLNSQYSQLQANAGMGARGPGLLSGGEGSASNGDRFHTQETVAYAPDLTEWVSDPTTTREEARTPDPYAEQFRQEQLEADLGLFFDMEGATGIPDDFAPADDWLSLFGGDV